MMFPFWNGLWTAAIVNHLWQSTVVTVIAWLIALSLRRNQARTRYWVWMIASVKFLIPFSLFIAAGEWLRSSLVAPIQTPALAVVIDHVAQPFSQTVSPVTIDYSSATTALAAHHGELLPIILVTAWLCGLLAVAISWTCGWWKIRASVRAASRMTLLTEVPVLSSPRLREPGIFGVVRPVLLPENITERLTAPQLSAILAHEMCHVRRRDNLTAAIHTVVVALFWFHPAVWWIKACLLEERERACDESVLQLGNKAEVYAESILNVCRFYVESPLACVSGVTGSDLKRRIVRIMTEQVARKLDFSRKLLLGMICLAAIATPIILGVVHVTQVSAQSATPNATQDISGVWQGTLHVGRDLRIVLKVSKANGGYTAVNYSIDQGGDGIPVTKITLDGTAVKFSVTAIGGSYEGKLSSDGKTIAGNWTQGQPLPLTFTRATPETEWTIPPPTPKLPPMDANANPSFEVATIKPSKPDAPGKAFLVQGRRFKTINTTLVELLSFAYGVHSKQLIGLPAWAPTDKFDIDAQPEGEGAPSDKQWRDMLQKLLVERFKLTVHHEKKELPVYVLSVGKTGPKLTKSDGDPDGLPGLFFRGKLGDLTVRNANMGDFTGLLQNAVLDRPVLDQTEIKGRYDFSLLWTPDDSQFAGMGARIPPSTDTANPPPNLYTAVQEQIGLKLEATKAQADVMVFDHVEKPSDN